ncbi:MAG: TIGR02186 family protein [Alphaproteobacteria bacterium]|jgi:hypothetical protein
MYKTTIIAVLLIAFTHISNATFLDVSTSPSSINIDGKDENLVISGTTDEKINLIIRVLGPLKDYKARRYQEIWGVWSLTKPQIIQKQATFYQIFSSQNIFASLDIETLRTYMFDPPYFISTQSQTPDGERITYMLIQNSLVSPEVRPIEFLGDHFYRVEINIPEAAATGEYTIQVFGIDQSGTIISKADTYFQITHEHENSAIKAFKRMHPVLYVATCIMIAIVIGFAVGSLRNAAKQQ